MTTEHIKLMYRFNSLSVNNDGIDTQTQPRKRKKLQLNFI